MITGDEDSRPEVMILLQLLREAEESTSPPTLRRWLRAGSPTPLERLMDHDFGGFEDALTELAERGFILRKRT